MNVIILLRKKRIEETAIYLTVFNYECSMPLRNALISIIKKYYTTYRVDTVNKSPKCNCYV